MTPDIEICEVGPRDGLQIIPAFMATEAKQAWIAAEHGAGVATIEVCSFIPPKLSQQFADAAEVVAFARGLPGLSVVALVPNLKGAERAAAAGAHQISFPLSASHSHSLSNLRKTPDEQLAELKRTVEFLKTLPAETRPLLSAGVSTAFGCSIEGLVPEAQVLSFLERIIAIGPDSVSLADTVGYGNPAQVRRVMKEARKLVGKTSLAGHMHDTMGLGLANSLAAFEAGCDSLDASLSGLGGCPYAPGASGNVATEDLVFMLESMGVRTGIDLEKLMAVREIVAAALPDTPLYGRVAAVGLPKSYRQALAA
jgi:hydroxymethylglutaryl-CoA lyase